MNVQMKILKQVAIQADNFRGEAKKLGEMAAKAFDREHKAQMKNLENIANSALKVSDVLDYIKRQTGRAKKNEGWKYQRLGEESITQIEDRLAKARDQVIRQILESNAEKQKLDNMKKLEIYLLLIREFIRQIVIHYEYEIGG